MISYFCACREPIDSTASPPLTLYDPSTFHPLHSLQFCAQCNQLKCHRCIQYQITSKFCPQCVQQMSIDSLYCSRSCFTCPQCLLHLLAVTSESLRNESGKITGKIFHFKCPSCDWSYSTDVIKKPQALQSIIVSIRDSQDPVTTRFAELQEFYSKQLEVSNRKETSRYGLKTPSFHLPSSESSPPQLALLQTPPTSSLTHVLLPLPTAVRAAYQTSCKSCKEILTLPSKEAASSRLSKTSNATDYIPKMWVTRLRGDDRKGYWTQNKSTGLLLSFRNPLKEPISIKITLPNLQDFNASAKVRVNVPCSEFEVGARPEEDDRKLENYIKSIPTVLLTDRSKISRVELMTRPADSLERISFKKRVSDGIAGESSESSFSDEPADSGINWTSIRVNVEVKGGELQAIIVPFYVEVGRKEEKYGYWVRVELGSESSSEATLVS
ncbi:DEKNAAC105134 [Brettanomyces naardenensis]|uniref:Dynactin subunit 4 n=1 Tax=Brettanomyces naardenensis TaxID=13370 RepID=A0A448YST1_BRENA|nr:DEKNAAC105134 [Brettanomyces naardenensis]